MSRRVPLSSGWPELCSALWRTGGRLPSSVDALWLGCGWLDFGSADACTGTLPNSHAGSRDGLFALVEGAALVECGTRVEVATSVLSREAGFASRSGWAVGRRCCTRCVAIDCFLPGCWGNLRFAVRQSVKRACSRVRASSITRFGGTWSGSKEGSAAVVVFRPLARHPVFDSGDNGCVLFGTSHQMRETEFSRG